MAEPPFKCSIQFPTVSSSNDEEDEKNSFEIIHKSEAEDLTPVVVLLGWAGCQQKHLAKYGPIYEKKGFITVRLTVQTQMLFFQSNKVGHVAQALLDILAENKITSNPIIFHVFSNGGCLVYSHISSLLNNPESEYYRKLFIHGVVFDSCPGKRRIMQAVKAFMTTLPFNAVARCLLGLCLLVYLFVTRILVRLLPVELSMMEKGFSLYTNICEDPLLRPQLFLYSKGDRVVLSQDVDEAVATRKEKGVDVKSICWDDSQHVAHLLDHPEAYTKACWDFSTACLAVPAKL